MPRASLLFAVSMALTVASDRAHAQGVGAEVGYLFEGDGWTSYRLGLERPILGPLSYEPHGIHLRERGVLGARLWGGGLDIAILRDGGNGLYLIGGVAGGFASEGTSDWWASWSAGGGYQLRALGFLSLSAEARWRQLTLGRRDGLQIGARLSVVFGGRRRRAPAAVAAAPDAGPAASPVQAAPAAAPVPSEGSVPLVSTAEPTPPVLSGPAARSLGDSVVMTAAQMMGAQYRLGGTGAGGFDCSGLIQYAYGRHGIQLPRTSAEQATAGRSVARDLGALRPGDILTFSNAGGRVTHVGLYVGDGRFLHSARGGVQLSLLGENDPYGRWWYRRWVGVRRIDPQ